VKTAGVAIVFVVFLAIAPQAHSAPPVRYMLHGGMTYEPPSEEYLRFVEQVKPDVLVIGTFDQRLYATAFPSGKSKARAPGELLARWKEIIERMHRQGIRVVGQMEINVLSDRPADLKDSAGWFGYYDRQWDEKLLGKRPTKTAAELLEEPDLDARPRNQETADTIALCGCRVNPKALNACINKPSWREVQKRLVSAAVGIGVDGFMTNRNYFGHCACEHCRLGFRKWLLDQFTPEELKARFGSADLDKLPLTCVVGMHRIPESVPDELVMEKQRFIKRQVKEFFDEVYLAHGRKLKADLFAAQWNHMAYFDELHLDHGHLPATTRTTFAHGAADERWGLPASLWGRDESLIWYCNWGTTQNTILAKEYAGDTVLYGKLIRTMAGDKPFVVNKYDFYRPRNMMAEAAALGYATNAIATPWQTEEDRQTVLKYFAFLRQRELYFTPAATHAEVALIFPRRAVYAGDAAPIEYVESAGRAMIGRHVLFDMAPDDFLPQLRLEKYRAVVLSAAEYLNKPEREALARYVKAGGKVLNLPVEPEDRSRPGAAGGRALRWPGRDEPFGFEAVTVPKARTDRPGFLKQLENAVPGPNGLSRFDAPWTVEVHAYEQAAAKRLVLHLVNYNHREKAAGKSEVAREAPIAAAPVKIQLRLPERFKARAVRFFTPDENEAAAIPFRQNANILECESPGFLVYGLCVVEGE
jgi:hypothetical protein